MIQRMFKFSRVAALVLFGLAFSGVSASVTPAAACGYSGCGVGVAVVQPYVYQSCSCCGCGTGYYGAAYAYPTTDTAPPMAMRPNMPRTPTSTASIGRASGSARAASGFADERNFEGPDV
jgi:hypothetical protein